LVEYFPDTRIDSGCVREILGCAEVIADGIFAEEQAGWPVYLDLDSSSFAARIGDSSVAQLKAKLIAAVVGLRDKNSVELIFKDFVNATKIWRQNSNLLETPPALSLLAVLTLAASEMEHDEDMAGNAYYPRLKSVFERSGGLKAKEEVIGRVYRKYAVGLWESLIEWLEAWNGDRGLATVPLPDDVTAHYAHKYVRMPISQVVLKELDRQNLHRMFMVNNLDPAMTVSEELMHVILGHWCNTPYATAHLKKIWEDVHAQGTLALKAISSLGEWTGARIDRTGELVSSSKVGLTLLLDKWTKLAEFGVEIRYDSANAPTFVSIQLEDGSEGRFRAMPAGFRSVRLGDSSEFDIESLVAGVLKISDSDSGLRGERVPRALVPMLHRSSSNDYVEVESLAMGVPHGLLVRKSTESEINLAERVSEVLSDAARPGWSQLDTGTFSGFPDGWVFFVDVHIVIPFDGAALKGVLDSLAPVEGPSIQFSGGFRIPGPRARYLRSSPPEVTVVMADDFDIELSICDINGSRVSGPVASKRAAFLNLAQSPLPVGEYTVVVSSTTATNMTARFVLVDPETHNPTTFRNRRALGHELEGASPFGVLSATNLSVGDDTAALRGLVFGSTQRSSLPVATSPVPTTRAWSNLPVPTSHYGTRLRVLESEPTSCLNIGAHHLIYPKFLGGPKSGTIEGVCKFCGLTRRTPARGRKKSEAKAKTSAKTARKPSDLAHLVSAMPPLIVDQPGACDDVFEALCFMRHGTAEDLHNVAARLSGGIVGLDRLTRYLSALGHIDVELDENCRPSSWSVSPTVLVMTSQLTAYLAGFRSSGLVDRITKRVSEAGGEVELIRNQSAPVTVMIRAVSAGHWATILDGITDPVTGRGVSCVENPCRRILSACAPISEVVGSSPVVRRPHFREVKKWDAHSASWLASDNNRSAGSFQNIGHGYKYTFNEETLELDADTRSGTASSVKHNAARIAGVPLYFYSPDSSVLSARLGAEMPVVINRALVSLTGRLPDEDEALMLVSYHEIPSDVAEAVHYLLTN